MSYASPKSPAPRLIGLGIVVLLHVLVFWAIKSGLAKSVVEIVRGPIETKIIEEIKPDTNEPPPPPPKFDEPPPPFVPPPEIAINFDSAPAAATAITTQSTVRTAPPEPKPVAKQIVAPQSTKRNSQPEYPPTSRRMGEAGTVILLLYIREDGRVGDVKIDKSSGFPRLDEAADREARRNWRFKPGTEDGKPVGAWTKIAVTFRLTD